MHLCKYMALGHQVELGDRIFIVIVKHEAGLENACDIRQGSRASPILTSQSLVSGNGSPAIFATRHKARACNLVDKNMYACRDFSWPKRVVLMESGLYSRMASFDSGVICSDG